MLQQPLPAVTSSSWDPMLLDALWCACVGATSGEVWGRSEQPGGRGEAHLYYSDKTASLCKFK